VRTKPRKSTIWRSGEICNVPRLQQNCMLSVIWSTSHNTHTLAHSPERRNNAAGPLLPSARCSTDCRAERVSSLSALTFTLVQSAQTVTRLNCQLTEENHGSPNKHCHTVVITCTTFIIWAVVNVTNIDCLFELVN